MDDHQLVEAPVENYLEQVQMLLLKGQTEEALRYVTAVLNNDVTLGKQAVMPYLAAFDRSFRTACRKNNVIAGYVVVEVERDAQNVNKYKMVTGGHHIADAVLSYHLRPLRTSLGESAGPDKSYIEVLKTQKQKPFNI